MKVLLVDNYDSFVFNLKASFEDNFGAEVEVHRNRNIPFGRLKEFDLIALSPGPGIPSEAGDLLKLINLVEKSHPLLGVCLGHQAIGEYYGAQLKNLATVKHGVSETIQVNQSEILKFDKLEVGRYHSWVVAELPYSLQVLAVDDNNEVMALVHKTKPILGLQFHPESVLTKEGDEILKNCIAYLMKKS